MSHASPAAIEPNTSPPARNGAAQAAARLLWGVVLALAMLWAFGAIWFDFPGHQFTAWVWLLLALALRMGLRHWQRARWVLPGMVLLVWLPWVCIRPQTTRDWAAEYAMTPRATLTGDVVTIHNVRNFRYQHGSEPGAPLMEPRWETRTLLLSRLRAVDMFINYWGSPWLAHPILSFDFGADGHLAFSIETRRERGEGYSALAGIYKVYELTVLAGDERDLVGVRTNYRTGEDVYLYRLNLPAETARTRFLEYIQHLNRLHDTPKFYDVLLANCTTSIRAQIPKSQRARMDWHLLLNGKMDGHFFARHAFAGSDSLSFPAMKSAARINSAARAAAIDDTFSARIREGRPGFTAPSPSSPPQ